MNYFHCKRRHLFRICCVGFLFPAILLICCVIRPAMAEALEWYPFQIDENKLPAIADFSALNHTLNPADQLFAKDGHFFRVGLDHLPRTRDDQRVRLFGINLSDAANFPREEDAPVIARRLRALGFNAVRLHHLDSVLSDSDEQPLGILTTGAFPSFNQTALHRLRVFMDALKEEGLYVNLNLHVGYTFRYAVDQLTPLPPGASMPFASHPLHLFEPRMIALQIEYAQQLLRRLQLNNDPVLALVEINNESSLTGAWQRKQLDQLPGEYERILQQHWQHWLVRQHGSLAQACSLWRSCDLPKQGALLVKSTENAVLAHGEGWLGRVKYFLYRVLNRLGWQVPDILEPGLKLHQAGAGRRVLDFVRFLVEMDKQYVDTLRNTVHAEVGDLVPVTGTQAYFGGLLNVDTQQDMDYVDEHFYIDHYDFPHQSWDSHDWRIRDQSVLREGWDGLLSRAFYRDARKPFVISEFNQAYPNRQSAEIIPVMTAVAGAQDWDGLFFFQYGDGKTWNALPDSFGLSGMTGQLVHVGMSAAMFRYFQIPVLRGRKILSVPLEKRQMLGALGEGVSSPGYLDYLEKHEQVSPQQVLARQISVDSSPPLQGVVGTGLATGKDREPRRSEGQQSDNAVVKNEKFLRYNAELHHLQVITPYSAFFAGTTASRMIVTQDMPFLPVFGGRHYGVMTLMSRDALPLVTSRRVMLSLSGATTGSQPGEMPQRPKELISYIGDRMWWTLEPDLPHTRQISGARDATGPVWTERIAASFFYPSPAKHLTVYPLDGNGSRLAAVPDKDVPVVKGGFSVTLHQSSPWFELIFSGTR